MNEMWTIFYGEQRMAAVAVAVREVMIEIEIEGIDQETGADDFQIFFCIFKHV